MKSTKQRVLMVHNFYQIGGGEHTVFKNEKKLLEENGHVIFEYTRNNNELKSNLAKKLLLPFTTFFSFKTYREVKRCIRENQVDIVHCHNTFPLISPAVYYAAFRCGVPVIQTIHNFRFLCPCSVFYRDGEICEDCMAHGLRQSIKHGCYRGSKIQTAVVANMLQVHRWLGTYKKIRYIFLTEFNRNKFRALLGSKANQEFVKPNFEYIEIKPAEPKQVEFDKFIFIGRLDENKGIRFIIDAWQDIKDKRLIIYGNGPLEQFVKDIADKNPLIEYRGFCEQDLIFRNLATASALIFSSECYEGFPMTIIESFAAGIPILCTDIGNAADIVKNAKGGICYKSKDVTDFCSKIDLISTKETNLALRKCARSAYENCYTPDTNYRLLKDIYDSVCGESNG